MTPAEIVIENYVTEESGKINASLRWLGVTLTMDEQRTALNALYDKSIGWRPISTVPINEPVLVFADGVFFVAVWLLEPYPHWKGRDWLNPSHWMKLPEKPRVI